MSRLIYVVPWAICDTENLYIKKVEQKDPVVPKEQEPVEDWTVQQVIPSPDKRSKDIYILVDVYRGYDFQNPNRQVSVLDVTNSISRLQELGYQPAGEGDRLYIRQKVLKWDKLEKQGKKKK